jgi:hypothetical protein
LRVLFAHRHDDADAPHPLGLLRARRERPRDRRAAAGSLDHPFGADEKRRRHGESESLGGLTLITSSYFTGAGAHAERPLPY